MRCFSEMFSRHIKMETGIEDIRDAVEITYGEDTNGAENG